jgi:hypothetical protein
MRQFETSMIDEPFKKEMKLMVMLFMLVVGIFTLINPNII